MPHVSPSRPVAGLLGLVLASGLAVGTPVIALAEPAAVATSANAAAPPTGTKSEADRLKRAVTPKLDWVSCGAQLKAFQCATATVPLDYDRPRGASITLALTRLPARDSGQRIGSLFTNPGGPGGSGVDFVQGAGPFVYADEVLDRFDIIGFDPRGVARSTPATCYPTEAAEQAATAELVPFPINRAERVRYNRESAALARSCAQTSPRIFRHMSTANVARDMDLLRQAVGDKRLSFAGYSYGTFLGATYAELFPGRIRAMVLDGTLDPREYSGRGPVARRVPVGNRIEQDRGGAEVFAEFLAQCRRAGPQRCSLRAAGDPQKLVRTTFDALKGQPVTLTGPDGQTVEITYQLAVASTFSALYSATLWSDLADFLTLLSAATADPTKTTVAPSQMSAQVAALLELPGRTGEDYASIGGYIGSTCVDTITPPRRVFGPAANASDRLFPYFGRYRTWVGYPCSYLRAEGIRDTDAYTGPWQQKTHARVLVLGTRHDPATPYKNTRPYANLFKRSSVVTLNGWGHTTLGQSVCTDDLVAAYLLHPKQKRRDAVCATEVKPFAVAEDADQASRAAVVAATVGR